MSGKYLSFFSLFFVYTSLQISVKALNPAFNQTDREVFVNLLNDIPTWETEKIVFTEYELKQLSSFNEDDQLTDKYKKKLVALRCVYGYAIKSILWDLHFEVDSSRERARRVRFSKKAELLVLSDDYDIDVHEVLRKGPIDLTDDNGAGGGAECTNDIKDIAKRMSVNQLYTINTTSDESAENHTFLNVNHKLLKVYVAAMGRMISVMIMSQTSVSNWMWMIYLYLKAADPSKINQKGIATYFKYAEKLLKKCYEDGYLGDAQPGRMKVFDAQEKYKNKTDSQSMPVLKKLKLMPSGGDDKLSRLFKYENMLGIYDAFWTKKTRALNIIPAIKTLSFTFLRRELDYADRNFETMWNNVPFSIARYYQVISDAMKMVVLYSWSLMNIKNERTSQADGKKSFDWFVKSPLEEIQNVITFFHINYENVYSAFGNYSNKKIKLEQGALDKLNDVVLVELRRLMVEYKSLANNKNIREHLNEKIDEVNVDECLKVLSNYFQYIKKFIEPLDFNVIKAFESSQNSSWVNFH